MLFYTLGFILFCSVVIDLSFELNYLHINASSDYHDIQDATVAIVPGAAVYGNKPSPILADRLKSALLLYKNKKVKKILLSGDNGIKSYNELKPMLEFMLTNKVKKEDIFVDNAGFRTFDTIMRARHIFEVEDAVIVTQKFHQPRAAFIAENVGIKVSCMESDIRDYRDVVKNRFREYLARNLAWIDIHLGKHEKEYTGKKFPITGSGESTWKLKNLAWEL